MKFTLRIRISIVIADFNYSGLRYNKSVTTSNGTRRDFVVNIKRNNKWCTSDPNARCGGLHRTFLSIVLGDDVICGSKVDLDRWSIMKSSNVIVSQCCWKRRTNAFLFWHLICAIRKTIHNWKGKAVHVRNLIKIAFVNDFQNNLLLSLGIVDWKIVTNRMRVFACV